MYKAGGYETDPFGDEFNTIGLQISTKKKGSISDTCRQEVDCSAELDDVTRSYKADEASGPGTPTNPSSGPDVDGDGSPGRRRRVRRVLTTSDDVVTLNFTQGLGINPDTSSVLVNEPMHPDSGMTLTLPFRHDDLDGSNLSVSCVFNSYAMDYRDRPFVNESYELSRVSFESTGNVVLAPGQDGQCVHHVDREQYRRFAATYLDDDLETISPEEHAYAVWAEVVVTVTNTVSGAQSVFEATHKKMICSPRPGSSTRSGAMTCEAHRGRYVPNNSEEEAGGVLYHLTTEGGRTCTGLTVNDGRCNNATNNYDNCWDGGDCCSYSCFYFNGGLITTDANGNIVPQHECHLLNDTETCVDPALRDFVPPPEYTGERAVRPVAFGGNGSAEDFGESLCDADALDAFESNVSDACASDPCSETCANAVSIALCREDAFARLLVDCVDAMLESNVSTLLSCNRPRCAPRTLHGCRCKWTWSYGDGTYTNARCGNPNTLLGTFESDWCPIVPGSCSTVDGFAYIDEDDPDAPYWDECGSGFEDTSRLVWTQEELTRVDAQASGADWSNLDVVSVDNGDGTNDDDDEDEENGNSNDDDNNTLVVVFAFVGGGLGVLVLASVAIYVALKCRAQKM